VAGHYRVRPDEIVSKSRCRSLTLARQVAMYLARKYTSRSFAEIGGFFGGRNHTSVKSAEAKVEVLRQSSGTLAKDIEALTDSLES
jgi:chromosomal replication initiator protein